MLSKLLTLSTTALLSTYPMTVDACSCAKKSVEDTFDTGVIVFSGRLLEPIMNFETHLGPQGTPAITVQEVTVEVDHVFIGENLFIGTADSAANKRVITTKTATSPSTCGLSFDENAPIDSVFIFELQPNSFSLSACGISCMMENDDAVDNGADTLSASRTCKATLEKLAGSFNPADSPAESTATAAPTADPTAEPTAVPTAEPTAEPTAVPTAEPTAVPTAKPTAEPTAVPTAEPTASPAESTADSTAESTAESRAVREKIRDTLTDSRKRAKDVRTTHKTPATIDASQCRCHDRCASAPSLPAQLDSTTYCDASGGSFVKTQKPLPCDADAFNVKANSNIYNCKVHPAPADNSLAKKVEGDSEEVADGSSNSSTAPTSAIAITAATTVLCSILFLVIGVFLGVKLEAYLEKKRNSDQYALDYTARSVTISN